MERDKRSSQNRRKSHTQAPALSKINARQCSTIDTNLTPNFFLVPGMLNKQHITVRCIVLWKKLYQ